MTQDKIKMYKSGASVIQDVPAYNGMITVKLYAPDDSLLDKVRVDTRSAARDYFRAFCAIAKNLK